MLHNLGLELELELALALALPVGLKSPHVKILDQEDPRH